MNDQLRFGIEEEYFITNLVTRQMPGKLPCAVSDKCKAALGQSFAYEMFQSQIEVASPVFMSPAQAADYLANARGTLQRALQSFGLGLLCAGSHPLADWRMQHATEQNHFQQLFTDYQRVARRSLLSGLHVHVEIPHHVDRIQVMNEVLAWTPLLLALSSSSPFWDGGDSGFASYRQTACDEWPRMGVPEFLENQRAYDAYVAFLISTGSMKTPSDCWWGVRPSARYPTLELRMTDACPRVDDALSIASFFRLMIAYAIEQRRPGAAYSQKSRWILMENRWRAKRSGVCAAFLVEGFDRPFTIEQWLFMAEQILGETAQALGVESVFSQLRRIVREGSSAERQRYVFDEAIGSGRSVHAALSQVVDHLLRETADTHRASTSGHSQYESHVQTSTEALEPLSQAKTC
ncbi:carboxylate-amine ligase [Pseudomonas sp. PCH199]|uniref:carboxylate-amine ligase n=1 Tax=unclassified Pseudomonas TaxID=196821 RepID=UPI000BD9E793|nr:MULTISPECIES: carboxylate-amine ligase [unclassified Pseudomonas]MCW8278434.1 carboxylate-amine ligase [Pseudomonas sp. PCH199]PAM81364.1 carboxylate-amine ligase [Pseudomonas sp. ERMR1:02]